MKSNVESRVNAFKQNLDKFAARWHQLKPKDIDMEGDNEACINAVNSIKERRAEFNELEENKEKLMYAYNIYACFSCQNSIIRFCVSILFLCWFVAAYDLYRHSFIFTVTECLF